MLIVVNIPIRYMSGFVLMNVITTMVTNKQINMKRMNPMNIEIYGFVCDVCNSSVI